MANVVASFASSFLVYLLIGMGIGVVINRFRPGGRKWRTESIRNASIGVATVLAVLVVGFQQVRYRPVSASTAPTISTIAEADCDAASGHKGVILSNGARVCILPDGRQLWMRPAASPGLPR